MLSFFFKEKVLIINTIYSLQKNGINYIFKYIGKFSNIYYIDGKLDIYHKDRYERIKINNIIIKNISNIKEASIEQIKKYNDMNEIQEKILRLKEILKDNTEAIEIVNYIENHIENLDTEIEVLISDLNRFFYTF